jgi:hypothetical protein
MTLAIPIFMPLSNAPDSVLDPRKPDAAQRHHRLSSRVENHKAPRRAMARRPGGRCGIFALALKRPAYRDGAAAVRRNVAARRSPDSGRLGRPAASIPGALDSEGAFDTASRDRRSGGKAFVTHAFS